MTDSIQYLENLKNTNLKEFENFLVKHHEVIFSCDYQTPAGVWNTKQVLVSSINGVQLPQKERLVCTVTTLDKTVVEGTVRYI